MAKLTEDELGYVLEELTMDTPEAVSAGSLFCANWPKAKAILKLIGGVSNSWVKVCVSIILQIGNALASQCPK